MARLADGDRAAFDPLYDELWPLVCRFAQRSLGGTSEAEDVAQVVMMKIFSHASEFDSSRNALSWILGVSAYECKTFRQKRRRSREDPLMGRTVVDYAPTPEEAMLAQDLAAAAHEVLGTLQPVDIETIQAVIEGKRPEVPAATFRKRVERTMSRWRTAWRSRHGVE